nr:hypothetical protein [Mycoplasmopsis bovis]
MVQELTHNKVQELTHHIKVHGTITSDQGAYKILHTNVGLSVI